MAKQLRVNDTQQAFLNSFTLRVEDKTGSYPRLGEDLPVFIKELTADDYAILLKAGGVITVDDSTSKKTLDLSTMKGGDSLIVSLGLCSDASGNLMFGGDNGRKLLGNVPNAILKPIAHDIRVLSGLANADGEDLELLDEAKND